MCWSSTVATCSRGGPGGDGGAARVVPTTSSAASSAPHRTGKTRGMYIFFRGLGGTPPPPALSIPTDDRRFRRGTPPLPRDLTTHPAGPDEVPPVELRGISDLASRDALGHDAGHGR